MTSDDVIIKKTDKTDAVLLFSDTAVYKIFTTKIVDKGVLDDLIRLDKLSNRHPVCTGITAIADTPFIKEDVDSNSLVIVMRRLPDDGCLLKLISQDAFGSDGVKRLASFIYEFHTKTLVIDAKKSYLWDRLQSDLDMVKPLMGASPIVYRFYLDTLSLLEANKSQVLERPKLHRIVEGHGDLNLGHLYLEDETFCFIDFSHKRKYRIDDVSRDLGGVALSMIENDRYDFACELIKEYAAISADEALQSITALQMRKKLLLNYYIYSGGYSPEHCARESVEKIISTITNWKL